MTTRVQLERETLHALDSGNRRLSWLLGLAEVALAAAAASTGAEPSGPMARRRRALTQTRHTHTHTHWSEASPRLAPLRALPLNGSLLGPHTHTQTPAKLCCTS